MPLPLQVILSHPAVRNADPVIRTPNTDLQLPVRWVHGGGVLWMAHVLRGGELLLTGGTTIAEASYEERRAFITELADRQIAALAIETGPALPRIPDEVLEFAESVGLPIVELRRFVPFVEIVQVVNSLMVNQSVGYLDQADTLSRLLSRHVASGSGTHAIVREIALALNAPVVLTDLSGQSLAAVDAQGDAVPEETAAVSDGWHSVDVAVRGIMVATLRLGSSANAELTSLIADRAVDALSLALATKNPPDPAEVAAIEYLRLCRSSAPGWRLRQMGRVAGLSGLPLVGVVAHVGTATYQPGRLEQVLRGRGRRVVSLLVGQEFTALVIVSASEPRAKRAELIKDLRAAPSIRHMPVAVGPLASDLEQPSESLADATLTLELASSPQSTKSVFDSDVWIIERLAAQYVPEAVQGRIVQEVLGDIMQYEKEHGVPLLETLDVWLFSGCSTTTTSKILLLRRQSVHHRLQRIFDLLGGDPRTLGRLPAVHAAVRLALLQGRSASLARREWQGE